MSAVKEPKRRLKILFVDDEPFAMSFYVEDLRDDNMDVTFCTSAENAQTHFGEEFDLAVLDVMMYPGPYHQLTPNGMATGLYLLREFREHYPQKPVIILTNSSDPTVRRELEYEPLVRIIPKIKVLPSGFPAEVRSMLP